MAIKIKRRDGDEVNSSSMADIAFLLLIFFLVTTTIVNEKGIAFIMPKKVEDIEKDEPLKDRNVYVILVNSNNQLLVENKPMDIVELRQATKTFLTNEGVNPDLSESIDMAVVSFRTDRGTDFNTYLTVLNELEAAYHELQADFLGIEVDEYLALDPTDPEENAMLANAKAEFPMKLSEAEPSEN